MILPVKRVLRRLYDSPGRPLRLRDPRTRGRALLVVHLLELNAGDPEPEPDVGALAQGALEVPEGDGAGERQASALPFPDQPHTITIGSQLPAEIPAGGQGPDHADPTSRACNGQGQKHGKGGLHPLPHGSPSEACGGVDIFHASSPWRWISTSSGGHIRRMRGIPRPSIPNPRLTYIVVPPRRYSPIS